MRLSLIAAVAENGAIGEGRGLPWKKIPADMRLFKRLTMGHHLIMGRRTFETLNGPLPGRVTVVVSRRSLEVPVGVRVGHSVEEALGIARAGADDEPFVVGGAEIYRLFLPRVERMYLTRIHASFQAVTFFPAMDLSGWRLVSREDLPAEDRNPYSLSFLTYDRVQTTGPAAGR